MPIRRSLAILNKLTQASVLAAGDVMLDRFVYGEASRLSPEAPVPVVQVRRKTWTPGGLGNVIMNLHALGAKALAAGVVGADGKAETLRRLLAGALSEGSPGLLTDPSRPTTVKTRVIAGIQQVVRYDEESVAPVAPAVEDSYLEGALKALPLAGALTVSDYGKGLLTPKVLSALLDGAREAGIPSIVDPKGSDYGRYRGATLVTPNRAELSLALGRDIDRSDSDALAEGGRELMRRHGLENVLVTRSEDGMTLLLASGETLHLPTRARAVFDVSGAGDTVVAAMAAALAAGADLAEGAALASLAAGVVVGKVGTATASPDEIRQSLAIEEISAKP
ncbi:MAG: D-glycero-beta-D-manno-heptose-7-phosphate kinase [Deltaproteobacteria bacterium]|jgi:D-beta-D-heptose 7-phosphate kinase/D-beta-D-heptose 1-phosphate adenosyltransferase|nr:D-glycero-beta-D-manno-heptose-7-phosphate kinase [Deltaproteobacteria bacterium]